MPHIGNWYRVPFPEPSRDPLEREERSKDRARLLLARYGIVFRELLQRELPAFRWSGVFRSLRLMELAGETVAGYFFHGIPGPQFVSHQALQAFIRDLPEDAVFWVNAMDPASPCGLQLDGLRGALPKRAPGTHIVFHGTRTVAVTERNGRSVTLHAPPDAPRILEYLGPLRHLLSRSFQPLSRITIETINGESAAQSPYVDALRTAFEVSIDHVHVTLHERMFKT